MSELGNLLEVLHDSRDRWQTMRGEYRIWPHAARPSVVGSFVRDGTDLTLSSHELDGESLVDAAAGLVPAPTEPPDLAGG